MKTPYKNIYSVLRINRLIVISVVVTAFLCSAFSLWSVLRMNQTMLNSMFAVNTDGSVIPLKLSSAREHREIEALAHLDLFHRYFYGLEPSSYERQLERALWLGDSSVDNVYRQKKQEGLYNRLLQFALVQRVIEVNSSVELHENTYSFQTTTRFEVRRGEAVDRYELQTSGNLIEVDRNFPSNTHGLLITNFFENSLKKISHEN